MFLLGGSTLKAAFENVCLLLLLLLLSHSNLFLPRWLYVCLIMLRRLSTLKLMILSPMTLKYQVSSHSSIITIYSFEGHDLQTLLFAYMDELLFQFSADGFTVRKITITDFDTTNYKIRATIEGELFDRNRHPIGTEIKAITFSNMQIYDKQDPANPDSSDPREDKNRADIFMIVDI